MILKKEQFKDILKQIQQLYNKQNKFCDCLEDLSGEKMITAFIYEQPINLILNLLSKIFNDTEDEIGYFLFELNAVDLEDENMAVISDKEDLSPKDINGNPLYTDADTLYDYLISKMNE